MGGLISEESVVVSIGPIGIEAENVEDSDELVEGHGWRRRKNPTPPLKRKPKPYYMGRFILFVITIQTEVPLYFI